GHVLALPVGAGALGGGSGPELMDPAPVVEGPAAGPVGEHDQGSGHVLPRPEGGVGGVEGDAAERMDAAPGVEHDAARGLPGPGGTGAWWPAWPPGRRASASGTTGSPAAA